MADIERNAEYLSYQSGHTQKEAQGNITDQAARMILQVSRDPL